MKTIIIFTEETCDACNALKEELSQITLPSDFSVEYKDLAKPENKNLFTTRMQECQEQDLSVPAMYYDGECTVGRSQIIRKFQTLTNTQQEQSPKTLSEQLQEYKLSPTPGVHPSGVTIALSLVGPILLIALIFITLRKVKL